jgi:hypothetical protein
MDQNTLYILSKINNIDHTYTAWSAIDYLKNLSEETGISFTRLFVIFGNNCISAGEKLRFLLYLDNLTLSDRYDVLVESCTISHIHVFYEMENALGDGEFFDFVKEQMTDDNPICQYIREIYSKNNSSILSLEKSINFRRLLFNNTEKMSQTLEHILQVAVEVGSYDIIIQLGACLSKRRILGILTEHGDPNLIDKFFFLYKEYPEIKNLTPFI